MSRSDIDFRGCRADLSSLSIPERLERVRSGERDDIDIIRTYFQFGKYLLISSSREDTLPANLQGVWSDGLVSPWESDYHLNINLQMNYWPAEVANIAECANSLFSYMNNYLLPGGRMVAEKTYHARGMVVHHISDIYKFARPADGLLGLWPLGGKWLAYHMWEHYLYTNDLDFLKNTAYEYIRNCADFHMDTMFEGKDGVLLSGPSTSPENQYLVDDANGEKKPIFMAVSPTMDVEIIGGLLDFYIECEKLLGLDKENARRANSIRSRMPELRIGKFGQLCEWIEDYEEKEPWHRHISHAFALYPAAQISRATPKFFKAIETTVERRVSFGGGYTGWSAAWLTCLFARLRRGNDAFGEFLSLLSASTFDNLLGNHPITTSPGRGGEIFQIDANFGGCAAICEMLIQSHEGFISLLPAIDERLESGSFCGLRARGDYTVSAEWADGKITSFEISGAGEVLTELPHSQQNAAFSDGKGNRYEADGTMLKAPCNTRLTLI